jgi:hypothetical protein
MHEYADAQRIFEVGLQLDANRCAGSSLTRDSVTVMHLA